METNPMILFPFHWNLVGHQPPQIVLGKKSGKDSVIYELSRKGIKVTHETAIKILNDVKHKSIIMKRPLDDKKFKQIIRKYI